MKTLEQLGRIILENFTADQIRSGYKIDPSDVAEVGRQASA